MVDIDHLKRIVAGAVQETYLSELLGGPGADFLRRIVF